MKSGPPTMVAQARSFLVIALVTVLIWLLAEAESLRAVNVQSEVSFRPEADSGRTIRADADFPGTVTIRLEGSTARVDDLAAQLRKPLRLNPGMEGIPIEPGTWPVDLRTVIRNLGMVRESGASVADVDPPFVNVVIDNLVRREVRIRVEPPPDVSLESPPEATPQAIELRLPERLSVQLPADFQITATLDPDQVRQLESGRRTVLSNVPLDLPEVLRNVEGVRLSPSTVRIAVTLRSRNVSWLIPSVPVHFRVAPTETENWRITMPEESRVLTQVRVSGPSELIEPISAGRVKPIAFVSLSFEELERAAASGEPLVKEPVFTELPSNLKFELDESQRRVRITVQPREQPTSSPIGG
jgi:hypothetical protein